MGIDRDEAAAAVAAEFSSLFDEHHAKIWSYLRRRSDNAAQADDLAAEVFAIAWRRFAQLPPTEERRLWLFGVARNVLHNHRRSIGRQQKLLERMRRQPKPVADLGDSDHGLRQALSRLNVEDRDLLLMRAWDEIAVQDIAVLLDCTPNAVSLRLRKARAALRAELQSGEPDTADLEHLKDPTPDGHVVLEPTANGES